MGLSAGCAAGTPKPEPEPRIVVDASVSQEALPAWLAYTGIRLRWRTNTYLEQNPDAGRYRYTFAEEAAARDASARVWIERREFQKGKPDGYLDRLIEVFKAGYIREYTWTYLRDPLWAEPAGLRLAAFDAWRRVNLKDHRAETRARVEFADDGPYIQ